MNKIVEVINEDIVRISSREVAKMMDIERHSDLLKKIDKIDEGLKNGEVQIIDYWIEATYRQDGNGKENKEYLISKKGCELLIHQTRKTEKIKRLVEYVGVFENPIVLTSRFEDSFFNNLIDVLKPLGITIETQYFVDKYRLDGYIPSLNIAIEYDEHHHSSEPYLSQDKERQTYIESKIKCKFIRCDYKNTDNYNIGLVIKEIMNQTLKNGTV